MRKSKAAKADLNLALGDLGAALSRPLRANAVPEANQESVAKILTRAMDAAIRMGYSKVKDAARYVRERIRSMFGLRERAVTDEQLQDGFDSAMMARTKEDFANPEDRLTVSTAQPTAKPDSKTGYQPSSYTEKRVIDGADIKASKSDVKTIVAALRKYNTLSGRGDAKAVLQELHQVVVDNLLWLHDHVKPEVRARAKLWYDGANRIANDWTKQFDLNLRQTGGILAVFSPQMDWFKNVSLAERALVILKNHSGETWSEGMSKWAESWLEASKDVGTKAARLGDVKAMRNIAQGGKTLGEMNSEEAAYFVRAFDEAYFPRSYRLITPEGGFGDFVEKGSSESADDADESSVTWGGFGTIEKAVKIYRDGSFRTVDTCSPPSSGAFGGAIAGS